MKKHIAPALIITLLLWASVNTFGESPVATISSVKGKEVIVTGGNIGTNLPMGTKVYVLNDDTVIVMKVHFPMQNIAKCTVIKGNSKSLKKGMSVYKGDGSDYENISDAVNPGETKIFGNIEFVSIPGNTSFMDTPVDNGINYSLDLAVRNNKWRKVTVSPFWMGKYEVTQEQYEVVMGINPSYFEGNPNNPVEQVDWYDAIEFCNRLSKKTGRSSYYTINKNEQDINNENDFDDKKWIVVINEGSNGFRLPTEAEWKYAYSGGTTTKYYWGDSTDFSVINQYAVYEENSKAKGETNDDYGTHPVGTKKPNPFGLYDMSGNVYEWCWDWFYPDYNYEDDSTVLNPRGPSGGYLRVAQGGCWFSNDEFLSSFSILVTDHQGDWGDFSGFRIVLDK